MERVENTNNQSRNEKDEGFWREGKYIDAWSIVHFLSGLLLGFILNALGFSIFEGFLIAAVLVILWEIVEPRIWPGWYETRQNQIVDIIIGLIGYLVAKFIDSFINFLFTGKMYLDFSLAIPEIPPVVKLVLMLIASISILLLAKRNVLKCEEKDAKKELNDCLEKLKGKIDNSDLPEKQKKELKDKIDEAKKLIATCKPEDLEKAIEILRDIRKKLEKEAEEEKDETKKKKIQEIINDLEVAETFAVLILLKKNWKLGLGYGVRDVQVVCEGKEDKESCIIEITIVKPEGYNLLGIPYGKVVTKQRIEIKKEKCKEATEFIKELKKKVEACKYPTLNDAKKIWEFIDP